jgi:hypothetical protein
MHLSTSPVPPRGRFTVRLPSTACLALVCLFSSATARGRDLDFGDMRPVESGHRGYYTVRSEDGGTFLHAEYRVGEPATKEALVLRDGDKAGRHRLSWRWRALVLPVGGNDCDPDRTDSAASVYVAWRNGLRWYGLKYSWSTDARVGSVCDARNNPFLRGETVVLRTGGPLGQWASESIDVEAEFRRHFAGGDPRAEVPELIGVAVLTDGDDTRSPASADYASFVLSRP